MSSAQIATRCARRDWPMREENVSGRRGLKRLAQPRTGPEGSADETSFFLFAIGPALIAVSALRPSSWSSTIGKQRRNDLTWPTPGAGQCAASWTRRRSVMSSAGTATVDALSHDAPLQRRANDPANDERLYEPERVAGIEPAPQSWKDRVRPLHHTRGSGRLVEDIKRNTFDVRHASTKRSST